MDGRSFVDRDAALRYLEALYLEEVEHVEGLGHYEQRLKELFPDYIIKITKQLLDEKEYQYSHYYKQGDKELMLVNMEAVSIESTIEFSFVEREYVDPDWEYGWNGGGHSHFFPSFDIVLDHYTRLIGHGEIYRQKYAEEISKYRSDVKAVTLKGIYEAGGDSDDYNRYYVEISLEDGKTFSDSFFFSFDQMETTKTLLETMEASLATIKGSYLSVLEGEVSTGYSRSYYHDNQTWYEVNQIPISLLLNRAKRVKIEILEEKART